MDWIGLMLVVLGFLSAAVVTYNIRLHFRDKKTTKAAHDQHYEAQCVANELYRRSESLCESNTRSAMAAMKNHKSAIH